MSAFYLKYLCTILNLTDVEKLVVGISYHAIADSWKKREKYNAVKTLILPIQLW